MRSIAREGEPRAGDIVVVRQRQYLVDEIVPAPDERDDALAKLVLAGWLQQQWYGLVSCGAFRKLP